MARGARAELTCVTVNGRLDVFHHRHAASVIDSDDHAHRWQRQQGKQQHRQLSFTDG